MAVESCCFSLMSSSARPSPCQHVASHSQKNLATFFRPFWATLPSGKELKELICCCCWNSLILCTILILDMFCSILMCVLFLPVLWITNSCKKTSHSNSFHLIFQGASSPEVQGCKTALLKVKSITDPRNVFFWYKNRHSLAILITRFIF